MSGLAYELLTSSFGAAFDFEARLVASAPDALLDIGRKLGIDWEPPPFYADKPETWDHLRAKHVAYVLVRSREIPPALLAKLQRVVPNLASTSAAASRAYWASMCLEVKPGIWVEQHSGWSPMLPSNEGPELVTKPILDLLFDRFNTLSKSLVGVARPHEVTNRFADVFDTALAECMAG